MRLHSMLAVQPRDRPRRSERLVVSVQPPSLTVQGTQHQSGLRVNVWAELVGSALDQLTGLVLGDQHVSGPVRSNEPPGAITLDKRAGLGLMRRNLSPNVVARRTGSVHHHVPAAVADMQNLRVDQPPRHVVNDPRVC